MAAYSSTRCIFWCVVTPEHIPCTRAYFATRSRTYIHHSPHLPPNALLSELFDVQNDTQALSFHNNGRSPVLFAYCAYPALVSPGLPRVYGTGSCPGRTLVCGGIDSRLFLKGIESSNARDTSTPNPAHHQLYFVGNHGRSPGDNVYTPICSNMREEYGRIRRSRELGEACKGGPKVHQSGEAKGAMRGTAMA